MGRHACLPVGTARGSISSVRQEIDMASNILAFGPPPLTQQAADASIDTVGFIAAAVRGVDTVGVTEVVRPLWRIHLANWYPQLEPSTREWYANAGVMLASLRKQWPMLPPWQRNSLLDQWAFELPQMLWMLEPVLAQAQAVETRANIISGLAALRQQASQPPTNQSSAGQAKGLDALSNRSHMTTMLESYSLQMATSTMNLMRSMNHS
jgi:hypothetical protein